MNEKIITLLSQNSTLTADYFNILLSCSSVKILAMVENRTFGFFTSTHRGLTFPPENEITTRLIISQITFKFEQLAGGWVG